MARGYGGQVSDWNKPIDVGFDLADIDLDVLVSGRFYQTHKLCNAAVAAAAGNMFGTPLYIPSPTRFDRISCNVTTQGTASAKVRLGIYSIFGGIPQDLVLDAGEVAADTTGQKDITIDIVLPRGRYALAYNKNETAIALRRGVNTVNVGQTSLAITQPQDCWQRTIAYGALPSTWGSLLYNSLGAAVIALRAL